MHRFDGSLNRGERGEAQLDAYLMRLFDCALEAATMPDQKRGIDRWVTYRSGERQSLQYKWDDVGGQTGNVFIELGSLGPTWAQPGWAYSCQADRIVYAVPGRGLAYVLVPAMVSASVNGWLREFQHRIRAAENSMYWTFGIAIPLECMEAVAELVLDLRRAA